MKHNLVAAFGPIEKLTKEQVYSVVYSDLVSIGMLDPKEFPDAPTWRKAVEGRDNDFHVNTYAEDITDFTVPPGPNRTHHSIFNIHINL